ncbi:TetR/AcrR family transcriptional regulator [Paracraurococcus lichenis]|uniref:TetR/AcrR family transcriptional regulator n=1 Tax=Paracraurococcus lichenis TaxID=3064888 RepID=A0ABT9DSW0_9PROT|nr:TetR/AcrR family transcriptional regulator [Paracraurococcus sp. LOR1-02]MDO9706985.1 TetR/AcrR family transcriptional regulator [Paracraurococcus sp. LOR1-02]
MARITGSNGARTAAAIRQAALGLIYRQGFAAMNLRDLAAEVGIQPSSLYNHITSKQALLFDLMQEHMQTLLDSTDAALAAAGPGLMERLRAFLAHHVLYHMERRQEVYIANFELRALDPPNHRQIVAMRQDYEARLMALLEEGVALGELVVGDIPVTAYAMLAMLTGICTWYRPSGRLEKAELVALHTELALNGIRRR